jgi:hypothetical protein
LYRSDDERIAAMLMTRPGDSKKVFGMFGLIYGSFPLFAGAAKMLIESQHVEKGHLLWLILLIIAACVTGLTGFALGRGVPAIVDRVAHFRFPNRLFLVSVIGFCWGAAAGAAGGFFLFVIGAIVGAVLGGVAGAVAVPILVVFHNALRAGDYVERRHFLPFVFGITLTLCAFILGL